MTTMKVTLQRDIGHTSVFADIISIAWVANNTILFMIQKTEKGDKCIHILREKIENYITEEQK